MLARHTLLPAELRGGLAERRGEHGRENQAGAFERCFRLV